MSGASKTVRSACPDCEASFSWCVWLGEPLPAVKFGDVVIGDGGNLAVVSAPDARLWRLTASVAGHLVQFERTADGTIADVFTCKKGPR